MSRDPLPYRFLRLRLMSTTAPIGTPKNYHPWYKDPLIVQRTSSVGSSEEGA